MTSFCLGLNVLTQWSNEQTFCKQDFQLHYIEHFSISIQIYLKFVRNGTIYIKSALI